jgi:hypothetical protein
VSRADSRPLPGHGLPGPLPEGGGLRWQGAPRGGALARRAFHVRKVAFYFGLLILLRVVLLITGSATLPEVVASALWLTTLAALAIAILTLLAWAYSKTTVYSITDRRLIIRFGVALPMTVNIPFKVVESAGLKVYKDGTGDIPLTLVKHQRVNYIIMWPNVRPWYFMPAQPMIRCIADPETVAELLADALRGAVQSEDEQSSSQTDDDADGEAGDALASSSS